MPDKALIRPEVLDTTGTSCAACVVFPPSSSSPWRLERMWSTHHVTRQCLRSAVLRCKELLEHFPEQLPALLEALHLASQVPCDSSGWWANQNPLVFGGAPYTFSWENSVALEVSGILKFWRLNRSKTLHHLDGTLKKVKRPVPLRPFESLRSDEHLRCMVIPNLKMDVDSLICQLICVLLAYIPIKGTRQASESPHLQIENASSSSVHFPANHV